MRFLRYLVFAALLCLPSVAWAWLPPPFALDWGGLGAGAGQFNAAYDVAVDASGMVYVSDLYNSRVQKFDGNGHFLASWMAWSPASIAVNTNGDILVANGNGGADAIREFSPDGDLVKTWSYGEFSEPWGITVDADGFIYVADGHTNRVYKFTNDGTFVLSWGGAGATNGRFNFPGDMTVDDVGLIYVADQSNHRVQLFDSQGNYRGHLGSVGSATGNFSWPVGLGTDAHGYVYITDLDNDRVEVYRHGGYVAQWGSLGTGPGQFTSARGIGVAPDGSVYVADFSTNLVQKFGAAPVPTEAVTLGHIKAIYRGEKTTTP